MSALRVFVGPILMLTASVADSQPAPLCNPCIDPPVYDAAPFPADVPRVSPPPPEYLPLRTTPRTRADPQVSEQVDAYIRMLEQQLGRLTENGASEEARRLERQIELLRRMRSAGVQTDGIDADEANADSAEAP